jgi:hypothetical protein
MRIFVYFDAGGKVISASKANVLSDSVAQPFAQVGPRQGVLEVEPSRELEALDCHEICERYQVDVEARKLIRKTARGKVKSTGAKGKRR